MPKIYKIWIHIEEIDEEQYSYIDMENDIVSAGEFDTLEKAKKVQTIITSVFN